VVDGDLCWLLAWAQTAEGLRYESLTYTSPADMGCLLEVCPRYEASAWPVQRGRA
jgi:hypothetical protein